MRKSNQIFIILCLLFCISCRKYDENSGLSVQSKKGKITAEWKLIKLRFDGLDQGAPNRTLTINPDGTFSMKTSNATEAGKWQFSRSKSSVYFTFNNSGWTYKYYVVKLTGKEFWYDTGEGYQYQYSRD